MWPHILCFAIAAAGPADGVQGRAGVDFDTFSVSRLTCTIGNNLGNFPHRPGYNGIFSMTSPDEAESPFVPLYAGLNLEHYFDARPRPDDGKVFFEPRNFPMTFRKVNATTAELHQAATPVYKVESWTTFTLAEPYYVDVTFKCVPTEKVFEGGYLGVFWASYINAPADKSMYFLREGSTLDAPQWAQLCTALHGRYSTVRQAGDTAELPMPPVSDTLYQSFSPLRFSVPFFYGRFENMVLIYMWKPNPYLRLAHSPSGGGPNAAKDDTCPAWDFQLVVPNYEAGHEYGWQLRVAYKPWKDRADVLNEVRAYLAN
ncbi:MAG: hypothetical protein FJY92_09035 [Candidatus Hydrogenedentes bacterium]|nr:hypothetical protein [Candidatus Hydrogenedentota bacterium]